MANPWDQDEVIAPAKPASLGQYGLGNVDLTNRPRVKNPDGSISTVRSISANFDGQEVLLPTVSDDGRIMSDDEAIDQYRKTGRYLGKFGTVAEADIYADQLHREQEGMYAPTGAMPWEQDAIVSDKPLEIDIVGGTRESAVPKQPAPANPAVAPDGWKYGTGRDIAFGGRSLIQGAGSLLGAVGGDAFNNYIANPIARQLGMQEARPYREEAAALADSLGLPKAQTSGDRILGDVGEALTGTALTMGAGAGANALSAAAQRAAQVGIAPALRTAAPTQNALGQFLTAQPAAQVVSAAGGAGASSATREAGGSEGQQLAAGLAGGLGPSVLGAAAGATTRGIVRGRSGAQMQRTIDDFQALGAIPSVGQASGNRLIQGTENVLAGGPTSAGVMTRFAERQADDIGQGLQDFAGAVSPSPSAERAGRAIERGVDTFNNNVGATRRALYWQADQLIPDTTATPMRNTVREVTTLTTPDPRAVETTGGMIQPGIAALRQNLEADLAANGGNLTYGALRRIRSDIGEQIGNASPLNPPSDLRELNRLYAALSNDMRDAAVSQGPDAVAAANRANTYTRTSAKRLDDIQRVVEKAGGPEKVYSAVMAGTKDGGTTLRSVMQSLPPDSQRAVTAAVIRRMGLATPSAQDATGEAFSAASFLTNWNKVSPEAKSALFNRYGNGFSRDMDRIARVADNIKDGSKVFANPSGTANRAAAMTYGASLVGSMFTGGTAPLLAGGLGANVLSRLLTNPSVVRSLARTTTMPIGGVLATGRQLQETAAENNDPDLAALGDYMVTQSESQLNQAGNNDQQAR